jgi:predicted transcriptional regulator
VVGLDSGDDTSHELFVSWYAQWQFVYRKARAIRPNRAEIIVVLDECGYLIKPRAEFESALDELIKVIPEFGISLALGSQVSLSATALANTGYKIAMKNGHSKIFQHFSEAMGLTRDQFLYSERTISVGDAAVQVPFHGEPLLTALLPLEEEIPPATKEEMETSTKKLLGEIREYTEEIHTLPELHLQTQVDMFATEDRIPCDNSFLMPRALDALSHITSNQAMPVTQLYKSAKLSAEQGDKVKQYLEQNDLVVAESCKIYQGRGRQPVILQPTRKGIEYLKKHRHVTKVVTLSGRGNFEHKLYQHLIARHYKKQGFLIRKEYKDCDIAIEHPQKTGWFAIEVANGNSRNLDQRITRNTKAGAEKTVIVASNKETSKRYTKKYANKEGVEVHDIEKYLLKRGEALK